MFYPKWFSLPLRVSLRQFEVGDLTEERFKQELLLVMCKGAKLISESEKKIAKHSANA